MSVRSIRRARNICRVRVFVFFGFFLETNFANAFRTTHVRARELGRLHDIAYSFNRTVQFYTASSGIISLSFIFTDRNGCLKRVRLFIRLCISNTKTWIRTRGRRSCKAEWRNRCEWCKCAIREKPFTRTRGSNTTIQKNSWTRYHNRLSSVILIRYNTDGAPPPGKRERVPTENYFEKPKTSCPQ